MFVEFLFEMFRENSHLTSIIWREKDYSYKWLSDKIFEAEKHVLDCGIKPGSVVAVRSDFSPYSIAYLLSLIKCNMIVVPLSYAVQAIEEYYQIAEVDWEININADEAEIVSRNGVSSHPLFAALRTLNHPGLVLFSSGSTGKSKAAVHDFVPLLEKFKTKRALLKTITFLLFDHIGGINTLLHILSNAGTVISIEDRSPESVCKAIEKYQVELLPTSPTFLNMILFSKAYLRYDLSSLKLITYGTEPMPASTLSMLHREFPGVILKQTYGLSELGILSSKSRSDDSLWVKIGGSDYQTKIIDDVLYIKAKSVMLGYLNAPSPIDEDGWFNTQDKVETDGEWIRILGRDTDIINVGGQKVYPAEIESVILEMENVAQAVATGVANPLLGNVVGVTVRLIRDESLSTLKKRVREHCRGRLESYKIPAVVTISEQDLMSARLKKKYVSGNS